MSNESIALHSVLQGRLDAGLFLRTIRRDDMSSPAFVSVYDVIKQLYSSGKSVDHVSTTAALGARGSVVASLIPDDGSAPMESRLQAIRQEGTKRRLRTLSGKIRTECDSGNVSELVSHIGREVMSIAGDDAQRGPTNIREAIKEAYYALEQTCDTGAGMSGTPTGFREIDHLLSGLNKTDLIVLAARPSMGKTALAINMCANVAAAGSTVLFFSLEMSKAQLATRLMCSEANVDNQKLRRGLLAEADWSNLVKAANTVSKLPIYIDDNTSSAAIDIRAKSLGIQAAHGLDLVVVDYLQLMRGDKSESREREISEISRSLKCLAKDLKVPVIAVSQLNRSVEQRPDKRPMLSDLRESGAIEQDADVVCFVYRDEYYHEDSQDKGIAEVIVGKQRNGPVGTARVGFNSRTITFRNLK